VTRAVAITSAVVAGALLAGGCLDLAGPGTPPECSSTSDCNSSGGEICDEGVCWGDPPAAQYAIVVGPPPGRYDLAATEVTGVTIGADGWMSDTTADAAVQLHGSISAICSACREGVSIAATITVRRASSFPGGPDFLVTATSQADVTTGDSFSIPVPPIGTDDPPYQITIEPSATTPVAPDGPNAAEVVPPLRTTVDAAALGDALALVLEADTSRVINGHVLTEGGSGVAGMRVTAIGRVDPLRPLEPVSSTAQTGASGEFTLLLGADSLDVVDIRAVPAEGVIAPTLLARDQFIGVSPSAVELRMPSFPGLVHVRMPVVYRETNGDQMPVPSARVQLETRLDDVLDPLRTATFTVTGLTDGAGWFEADLIPGSDVSRAYTARIVPPAESIAASSTPESPITVGTSGGVLQTVELTQRSTLTGTIADAAGEPVDGETVTAVPALTFMWSLDETAEDVLRDRTTATTLSHPDGSFTLWVDPALLGLPITYDLQVEPPELSDVPRWVFSGILGSTSQDIGVVQLPDAAHVRGSVFDPQGAPLPGAIVRIYEIPPENSGPCVAENAPSDCQTPAILRASGTADEAGIVRLVLPR